MNENPNHAADIKNANKGMPGQNKKYAQNQGNKGETIKY